MEDFMTEVFYKVRDREGIISAVKMLRIGGYSVQVVRNLLDAEGYVPLVHQFLGLTLLSFSNEKRRLANVAVWATFQHQAVRATNSDDFVTEVKERLARDDKVFDELNRAPSNRHTVIWESKITDWFRQYGWTK